MPVVLGLGMLMAGAMSAVGSVNEANAQAKSAEGNAEFADEQANQLDRSATLIKSQAFDDEMRLRVMARKQMGANQASIGASGLQMTGSALDVMQESAANVEHDAAAIRMAGNEKSNSLALQARQQRTYAGLLRSGADATKLGGNLAAAGDLVSGGAHFAKELYG